jgi:DNA-binding GntR family transcriptional regulator
MGVSEAPSTKADDIALALEHAIVSGDIAPGTVLRQEQLSEQYAVSRTPVREALRRLAALGLVSFVPNRGVRVRTPSLDELREAFLVRAALESLATEAAAARFGRAEIEELEAAEERFAELTDRLRRTPPEEDGRYAIVGDWVRANHAFHDVIYRVAALPLVERVAKSMRFSGSAVWNPRDASELDELYRANESQHRSIIAALRAGSASGARELAREHVLASGALLERIVGQTSSAYDAPRGLRIPTSQLRDPKPGR